MKMSSEVKNTMVWPQVGAIDVESNYDLLVSSGKYKNDWLDDCFTIYVPKDPKKHCIAYHLVSGTIRVVGPGVDFCTDYIDVACHFLTCETLDGLYTIIE